MAKKPVRIDIEMQKAPTISPPSEVVAPKEKMESTKTPGIML